MRTQEVEIKPSVSVVLKVDSETLDEVIVVAYGTAKKSAFTGSASVVKAENIEKRQVSNVSNALSGAIAGGAETFFGKNKGRTIDGVLKKVTAVIAVLFVITSITLAIVSTYEENAEAPAQQQIEAPAETPAQ